MSPITKSMISRLVALELVGSLAYPAPAKQSLPHKAASRNLLVSSKFLSTRDARKEKGPFEVATRPVMTPKVTAQSQPQSGKMLDRHAYLINDKQTQRLAAAKGLDLTKIRRVRYDSKSLHPDWVARR
ncbi:hypothetical protein FIBSPDRAFT_877237 [Athelia psychrophila]|uniref:Uncharacterized protein n=1 Tax=Athelia psychrophila TaxID=1759441 RepID=A0A167W549_9AGAM|nr:hypothetical protein FIBSPDRAFT_877237 [Fibularhizoctonia sp. CBS 109695]